MTITPTYPGVYISELPSGNRTVSGVATSITGFVGAALRGPVDEPVDISNFSEFERNFGGLWRRSGLGYAVRDFYLNGGGQALIVRVTHPDAATARLAVGGLQLEAAGPGAWANTLEVEVTHPDPADAADIADGQGGDVEADDLFTLTVRDGTGDRAVVEVYRNVTMVDGPQRVDRLLESSGLVRCVAPPASPRPPIGTTVVAVADQGADGDSLDEADYAGAGFEAGKRGLYALEKADLVNLICLPPPTPSGELPVGLWPTAAAYAVTRRAFLVVDSPAVLSVDDAASWPADNGLGGLAMRNAAFYYPRIRRPDPLRGGALDTFAAGGAIAGVIARTDGTRGVWKAPAGIEAGLTGVIDLSVELTDDENGGLNPLGGQLPAQLPRHRPGGLGRANPARRRRPGRRVQIRARTSAGAVPRGEPVPRHPVGGVRAQRRTAVGADPANVGRVHAGPVPQGRVPGHDAARRVLRAVRRRDHDAVRHRSRHGEHPSWDSPRSSPPSS